MQIVWHGRYFEYFEVARAELFRQQKLDIPEVRDLGLRMYVADVRCRYMSPLTYGDDVEVVAIAKSVEPMIRVAYVVSNLTSGRKSARGHVLLAVTDAEGGLLSEMPGVIRERLEL